MLLAEYLDIPEYRLSLQFGDFWYYRYYNEDILINSKFNYKKVNTNVSKDTTDTLIKQLQLPIQLIHNTYPIKIRYDNSTIYQETLVNGNEPDIPWYMMPPDNNWYILHIKTLTEHELTRLFEPITIETHNIIQ